MIPANLGIGDQYANSPYYEPRFAATTMHTHTADGKVSWETLGRPPKREELYLGALFEVWGKPFSRECVLDACNGGGKSVRMLVNGQANSQFEKYVVADQDTIVVRYE